MIRVELKDNDFTKKTLEEVIHDNFYMKPIDKRALLELEMLIKNYVHDEKMRKGKHPDEKLYDSTMPNDWYIGDKISINVGLQHGKIDAGFYEYYSDRRSIYARYGDSPSDYHSIPLQVALEMEEKDYPQWLKDGLELLHNWFRTIRMCERVEND